MSKYYRESYRFPSIRIYLDSETADLITNRGNMIFHLKQPLSLPSDVVAYVELSEVVFTNTGYNVNESNNTLDFLDVDATRYQVSIKPGNYNANTLVSALNSSLAAYSTANPTKTMTVSYNNLNSLLNFQSSYAYNGDFTFRGTTSILSV